MTTLRAQQSSAYAPIRFARTRPWAREFRQIFRSIAEANQAALGELFMVKLTEAVKEQMQQHGYGTSQEAVVREQELMQHLGMFDLHGREIYDVSQGVVCQAQNYDVLQKRVHELALPETTVYLHFGAIDELKIDNVQYEGCFVLWTEQDARVCLAFVPSEGFSVMSDEADPRDAFITIQLDCDKPEVSVREALAATDTRLKTQNQGVVDKAIASLNAQFGTKQVKKWRLRDDLERQLASVNASNHTSSLPTCGSLVFGVLDLIKNKPELWASAWPVDAPTAEVEAATLEQAEGKIGVASRALDKEHFRPIFQWEPAVVPESKGNFSTLQFVARTAATSTAKSYFDYFVRTKADLALIQAVDADIKRILRKGTPSLAIGEHQAGELSVREYFGEQAKVFIANAVKKNPRWTEATLLAEPAFREYLEQQLQKQVAVYLTVLNHRLFGQKTVRLPNSEADAMLLRPVTLRVSDFSASSPAMSFVYTSRGAVNASMGRMTSPRDIETRHSGAGYDMPITAAVTLHESPPLPHPVMTIWAYNGSGDKWPKAWRRMLYLHPDWTWQEALSTDWERVSGEKAESDLGTQLEDSFFYEELRPFFNMIVASFLKYGGSTKEV